MTAPWTVEGRKKLAATADILVVAIAVSLPWSTSATGIFVGLWAFMLLPTLRWSDLRGELSLPAGGLPVLLAALGIAGMLWADVSWLERWKGLDSFLKLLAIPLLFVQFRQSDRGHWVFAGYLISCAILLVITTIVMIVQPLSETLLRFDNVIVKNAATQSGEFVTCVFGLLYLACDAAERRRWDQMLACLVIATTMLADILYASTGRTALVVAIVLLVLFAATKLNARSRVPVYAGAILIGVVAWASSPYLRSRTEAIWVDLKKYETTDIRTPSGERLEFWKKSTEFMRDAPVIGHGTGTILSLFEKSAAGKTGITGVAAANPHNQTFAVAIQLGLVGTLVLWAMWLAHLVLFRRGGLGAWIGLILVVQNIVGSLFNSHLFDFVQGWTYVVGVGVAGGMMLGGPSREQASTEA